MSQICRRLWSFLLNSTFHHFFFKLLEIQLSIYLPLKLRPGQKPKLCIQHHRSGLEKRHEDQFHDLQGEKGGGKSWIALTMLGWGWEKTLDINCLFANQICYATVGFHCYLALKRDGYILFVASDMLVYLWPTKYFSLLKKLVLPTL